jgi:hypothetical protein
MKKIILMIAALLSMTTMAYALPALQLDIVGGTYNSATDTETITASGNAFTLNALLITDKDNFQTDTYFLSAALIPSKDQISSGYSYGSFKIGNQTYSVTADMVYGIPPLEALYPNLGPHGIFPNYYKEISFNFPDTQYNPYNLQYNSGSTPTAGTGMYVKSFDIDISGLINGIGIHFDLYNENIITKKRTYDTQFAPFSHDTEGWKQNPPPAPVPEPSTILLLGAGLLGLAAYGTRRARK